MRKITLSINNPTQRKIIIIYGILLMILVVASVLSPTFRSFENISNILVQAVALGIVSSGQTFVILSSGIDLSVGSVMSLAGALASVTMQDSSLAILLGVMLGLGMGAGIGFANGISIAKLKIDPFIVTLATMSIAQGVALYYRPYPGGYIPRSYALWLTGNLGPLPVPGVLLASVCVLGFVLLHKRAFGRYVYALGNNEEVARLSGINVTGVKVFIYMISGVMSAVAGLFFAARMRSSDPLVGAPFTLDSIAAVVIGGSSFDGRGSIIGTIAGVFIITILSNILNLLNVSPLYQYIFKGLILIIAVAVYSVERRG